MNAKCSVYFVLLFLVDLLNQDRYDPEGPKKGHKGTRVIPRGKRKTAKNDNIVERKGKFLFRNWEEEKQANFVEKKYIWYGIKKR